LNSKFEGTTLTSYNLWLELKPEFDAPKPVPKVSHNLIKELLNKMDGGLMELTNSQNQQ